MRALLQQNTEFPESVHIQVKWGSSMLYNKRVSPPKSMELFDGLARIEHKDGKLDLVAGRQRLAIVRGQRVRAVVDDVEFVVDASDVNWALAAPLLFDRKQLAYNGASLLLHSAALFAFMTWRTPLADMDVSVPSYPVQAEPAQVAPQSQPLSRAPQGASEAGQPTPSDATSQRATTLAPTSAGRDIPAAESVLGLAEISEFGMIGVLASVDSKLLASPWGDPSGESLAFAGLGSREQGMWDRDASLRLSTTGSGGGGRGEGIGLGTIGTSSRCAGCAPQDGRAASFGLGRGVGHRTKPPVIRWGGGSYVSGRLPPEVVQRIVRQNFGRFRGCYESGLVSNPELTGRVSVSFVIGRDGSVSAANGVSEMPSGVSDCVTRSFYALSFPAPEGGTVNVTYPLLFSPS